MADKLSESADGESRSAAVQEQLNEVCVCETCAERGRPNEPVYKIGMCTFCYHGSPHPKASSEELARERMGAYSRS
jgi:hypothetical protein